jgi:hypothetical protein
MRLVKQFCLLLVLLGALPLALMAQYTSGSISGVVTDPNGAVVPAASIVATNVATGVQSKLSTDQAGLYVFPSLPVGAYTITVKQSGFKTFIRSGIEVRLDLREVIDIKLELGTVQQTVTVTGTAPVLETANATRGISMSTQTLDNLPLFNGSMRLANAFLGYMSGVNSNGEVSINGSTGRSYELLLDGASIVSPESGASIPAFPGFEAFGEMRLLTQNFLAEDGRVGGGIEEFTTRSGTNKVHGSAYMNIKSEVLDAVSWANNQNAAQRGSTSGTGVITVPANTQCNVPQAKACRPLERYNEEGGTAGGPVYLPHIYDGRNKTFFYFTYVEIVQPASISVTGGETVPTQAMQQGNFSGPGILPIYDPATEGVGGNAPGVRSQFAGNIIPTTRFSKISSNIVGVMPQFGMIPNSGTAGQLVGNYAFNSTSQLTDKNWSTKIDHQITPKNHVAFFYTQRNNDTLTHTYFSGPFGDGLLSFNHPSYERAADDYVINPHWLLHTVWGFSQDRATWQNPDQNGWGKTWGFPQFSTDPRVSAAPIINFDQDLVTPSALVSGGTTWGMNQGKVNDGGQWNWTTDVSQTLTWVHNKHEFKMGWNVRRMRTIGNDWSTTNGEYNFDRAQTSMSSSTQATTGDSFASFLLGDATSGSQGALPVFLPQNRYGYHAGFFQDTWRLRPNFTLNLGLRYEVPIGWHQVTGNSSTFSPTTTDPAAGNLPGAMLFMGDGPGRIGGTRPYPTDFSDVGPRAGFAWSATPTFVVRAAWGIYYEALGNGGCGCYDGFSGTPYSQSGNGFDPTFQWDPGGYNPNVPVNNPGGVEPSASYVPAALVPGVDNLSTGMYYFGPHFGKAPRIYDWNITLQKEYKGWLFETAYDGNRGHGLNSSPYMNALPPSKLYLMTAGPTGDTNLLAANMVSKASDICTYASSQIGCTNGVPNLPWSGFTNWGSGSTLGQAIRPFPQYGTIYSANSGNGMTWYDSLQTKVEHRFGDLNMTGTWVWSKTLDANTYRQIFTQCCSNVPLAQDWYNLKDAKTFAFEDFPNVVNFLMSYRLPFGRGKKYFRDDNGIVDKFVGGWMVSSYGQYRSGTLIELTSPTNYLSSYLFDSETRTNFTGAPIKTNVPTNTLDPNNPSIRWFTTTTSSAAVTTANPTGATGSASFVQDPLATLGNQSFFDTYVRNPWYRYEAIGIIKEVKIRESVSLKYSMNIFNPFNRTGFGGITTTITSTSFGRPTAAQDGPRVITMGLRLYF